MAPTRIQLATRCFHLVRILTNCCLRRGRKGAAAIWPSAMVMLLLDAFTYCYVRCVRSDHRLQTGAIRRAMATCPSRTTTLIRAFHQIRDFRDGHQGHRCARSLGARWQSGFIRRRGRWQDSAAHRDDPQHDRARERHEHFLRYRRALPRRRRAL